MIQIRDKDKLELLEIISNTLDFQYEIRAYGSRVKGTNHDGSDLDIAICYDYSDSEKRRKVNKLYGLIEDSNIPIFINLKDWNTLPQHYKIEIEKKYEVLN
jgi:predicted nucleotidyltransferase